MTSAGKIVVAVGGASGAIYARRLLDHLRTSPATVGIVQSRNACEIWKSEVGTDISSYDYKNFDLHDYTAPFASGSNVWDAMVVVPCSMGMIGRIAHGVSDDLITRAADVFLKERRTLILVPRETPWSLVHIENARLLTLAGATILPASPSFYSGASTIDEMVDTVVHRIMDHLPLPKHADVKRWGK